jgi:Holliday junction DNA helicase RuvB
VNDVLKFSSENREVVSGACLPEDKQPDILSLRPACFIDYVGQKEIVETLKIAVEAAKMRNEPVDHVLFHGPPGLGKTTLAHIIANETGGTLTVTSGPALEKGGDLIGILTHLEDGDVLFVDEVHRIPRNVEELLYPAMEDFAIDFVFDKGVHARSHRFRLKRFTLIGATTRIGLISSPLRDRFGILRSLDFYSEAELIRITKRSAALLDVSLDDFGAAELAARSRGTPRIVNRLLRRVRDYAQVRSDGTIKRDTVEAALTLEGVDEKGLTDLDRRFIRTVIEFYNGGPVGIEAIAATLQEETDTLVDVVEPYLLKAGLITRTSAGRKATEAAYRHLGFKIQKKLF